MVWYITQVTILWLIFGLIYYLILRNKSMFQFNRWYLLLTFFGALIMPLVPFERWWVTSSQVSALLLSEQLLDELVIDSLTQQNTLDWQQVVFAFFGIGSAFFAARFLVNIYNMWQLYKQSPKLWYDGKKVCVLPQNNQIFSFGRVIFMSKNIYQNIDKHADVWLHEKTHVRQWHLLDILLLELVKIVFWYHPLLYVYENNIRMNHEYLADETVVKQFQNIIDYQYKLLDYLAFRSNGLVSNFNFKLTKKRFIMMKTKTNKQSQTAAKVITVLGMVLAVTFVACTKESEEQNTKISQQNEVLEEPMAITDVRAVPPNGLSDFRQEIFNHIEVPEGNEDDVAFKLRFVIEKDGNPSNFEIVSDGDATSENVANQIIELMKAQEKWKPAEHQGKIVRSFFTLPIKIQLTEK